MISKLGNCTTALAINYEKVNERFTVPVDNCNFNIPINYYKFVVET